MDLWIAFGTIACVVALPVLASVMMVLLWELKWDELGGDDEDEGE